MTHCHQKNKVLYLNIRFIWQKLICSALKEILGEIKINWNERSGYDDDIDYCYLCFSCSHAIISIGNEDPNELKNHVMAIFICMNESLVRVVDPSLQTLSPLSLLTGKIALLPLNWQCQNIEGCGTK